MTASFRGRPDPLGAGRRGSASSAASLAFSISAFFSNFSRPARSLSVAVAIEINFAVDQHLLHLGVIGQRMLVEDHQVGVLARLDGANARRRGRAVLPD